MTTAKTEAEAGAPDNTVILAETQAAGRGRKQRSWASEAGGLYATLVLRPDLPLSYCHLFNFAAAISLAHVLQKSYQLSARVKWPNDVLVDGKKVAGILLEASGEPHSLSFLTVGMGINVNNDPRPANPEATSLRLLLGRPVSRSDLFSRVYTRFRSYIEQPDDSILSAWKAKSHTLGRRVCIRETDHTLTGTALDIQRDGALLVEKDPRPGEQKIVIPVYSGDIEEIR
jgi:BirA family biotin operon repressor/biotin-[acetyl-CoA-carboxylase] ligase